MARLSVESVFRGGQGLVELKRTGERREMAAQQKIVAGSTATEAQSQEHMLGHGFYNKHSQEQGTANRFSLPHLVDAVNAIDLTRTAEHFRIADYGSAQGRNSLLPIKTAIAQIKARWNPIPPITVTHTDLPTNDWTTLFQTLLTSPNSYLIGETNVFAFGSGISVYREIFPPNHIALGYSAIVEHWLSNKPSDIPNHIWSVRAMGNVHEVWEAQAKADWYNFLRYRAVELIPSGRLVIVGSGADPQGNSGAEVLIDLVNDVLQSMVKEGSLFADEYADMAIPTYYRTEKEWCEPFEDADFIRENPLSLLHYAEFAEEDVYLTRYKQTLDAAEFAQEYTGFFLAAFEPSLFVSLRTDRSDLDRERIIAIFSRKLETALAEDPAKYSARWWLALMVIAKA